MPQRTFISYFYWLFHPKTWNAISFHEHYKPLNHVSPLSCSSLNYLSLHFELYSLSLSQATLNCHNCSSWPLGQNMGYQLLDSLTLPYSLFCYCPTLFLTCLHCFLATCIFNLAMPNYLALISQFKVDIYLVDFYQTYCNYQCCACI